MKVYVVKYSYGQYDDYTEVTVKAYTNKDRAENHSKIIDRNYTKRMDFHFENRLSEYFNSKDQFKRVKSNRRSSHWRIFSNYNDSWVDELEVIE